MEPTTVAAVLFRSLVFALLVARCQPTEWDGFTPWFTGSGKFIDASITCAAVFVVNEVELSRPFVVADSRTVLKTYVCTFLCKVAYSEPCKRAVYRVDYYVVIMCVLYELVLEFLERRIADLYTVLEKTAVVLCAC